MLVLDLIADLAKLAAAIVTIATLRIRRNG
jgi:hypothetical protein